MMKLLFIFFLLSAPYSQDHAEPTFHALKPHHGMVSDPCYTRSTISVHHPYWNMEFISDLFHLADNFDFTGLLPRKTGESRMGYLSRAPWRTVWKEDFPHSLKLLIVKYLLTLPLTDAVTTISVQSIFHAQWMVNPIHVPFTSKFQTRRFAL